MQALDELMGEKLREAGSGARMTIMDWVGGAAPALGLLRGVKLHFSGELITKKLALTTCSSTTSAQYNKTSASSNGATRHFSC